MGSRIAVRRWPAKYFGALIQSLRKVYDFHLLLIPDPDGFGQECAWLADSTLLNLTTRELVGLLGSSNLLLCNDSGPAHIAAASGRPVIAIFGPTAPALTGPYGDRHIVLRAGVACSPCFKDSCANPVVLECMQRISITEVRSAVQKFI